MSARPSRPRVGDFVRVEFVPPDVTGTAGETRRVFQLSVGRQFKVRARNPLGWLELHVGRVVDEKPYKQSIWIEPESVGDRYHVRALETPREVRHALVYVLQNWRKHLTDVRGLDPRSSAAWFTGWRVARIGRLAAARTSPLRRGAAAPLTPLTSCPLLLLHHHPDL